jgi:putative ABC transport system substrate-binding protein
MMRRRDFLAGMATGAMPRSVGAQQPDKTARVGVLVPGPPDPGANETYQAFGKALRDLGWIEGQNLTLEFRYANNRYDELPRLARELVALKSDVIFAVAAPATRAAVEATSTTPIVFETLGDATGAGLVAGLARPGRNVTGISGFAPELIGNRLQIIQEILPNADRIGVLANLANPTSPAVVRATESAGRQLRIEVHVADVRAATEVDAAFDKLVRHAADALLVVSDPLLHAERGRIVELAARHRLPAVYEQRLFTAAGGLLSYGPGRVDRFLRAAVYVDRVLRGTKPADLPIEQPTKFELVINLKAARALGLTIPPSLLLRADQVIE